MKRTNFNKMSNIKRTTIKEPQYMFQKYNCEKRNRNNASYKKAISEPRLKRNTTR